MNLLTWLGFLFGDRRSIYRVAACPGAVWLGLLFVLSAGFAREYDGEDLLHEPWHLLLPLAASLGTSFLLFWLVWSLARGERWRRPFWLEYRSFLGLYWMTAPLAWLYAIPVERFLSPAGTTEANLWLLGAVATWRVLLMIRVIGVLYRSHLAAFFTVLCFANVVAFVALFLTPLPVIAIMGGIRLTESEAILQDTGLMIRVITFLSAPLWLICMSVVGCSRRRLKRPKIRVGPVGAEGSGEMDRRVTTSIWGVAVLAMVVWAFILPFTQPEQQLRWRVEHELEAGQIVQALETMSAHEQDDFPPHWDPPPRIVYGQQRVPLIDVIETLVNMNASPWVREVYLEKYRRTVTQSRVGYQLWVLIASVGEEEQFERHLAILDKLPRDSRVIMEIRNILSQASADTRLPGVEQQNRLREVVGLPPLQTEVNEPADVPSDGDLPDFD